MKSNAASKKAKIQDLENNLKPQADIARMVNADPVYCKFVFEWSGYQFP